MISKLKILTKAEQFSIEIGSNSLIVKGPSEKVSQREEDTSWINASRVWLPAKDKDKDTLILTGLNHIRDLIKANNFVLTPVVTNESLHWDAERYRLPIAK